MNRFSAGRARGGRSLRISVALLALVSVLVISGEAAILGGRSASGTLNVSVEVIQAGPISASFQFRISAPDGDLVAHVALVPGTRSLSVTKVLVFYDVGFHVRFANPGDVLGLSSRLSTYLATVSPPIPVSTVNASSLPNALNANPKAALVDFGYGTIPDNVLSRNTSLLENWIYAGGTLIWAGGPLAYFEGHLSPSGAYQKTDLGWSGQNLLAGFRLEDPVGNPATRSSGPLLASNETALGSALGVQYPGAADGANTSELAMNHATDLGFDSLASGGAASRTSLAFVPIGNGGILYFGGAVWGTGSGTVPLADASIAGDVALLLRAAYAPAPGPTSVATVTVAYWKPSQLILSVNGSYTHIVGIVTSTLGPAYLFQWSQQLL